MCAIAGMISKDGEIDQDLFERMVDLVEYRGPDDRGVDVDIQDGVALGHRRLAILDLSKAGHQPFHYLHYTVVFNGEIYNYLELKRELKNKGYFFSTETDTEVLAASYDYWGDKCVDRFNGMWAFAIYNRKDHVVFCSRDRFGVKPFYYLFDENNMIFGSEIKQILLMSKKRAKANRVRLKEFLVGGIQDYAEDTFFEGINQIPPSCNYTLNLGTWSLSKQRYWDIGSVKQTKKSYGEAVEEFKERFFDSIKLRLRADVPVGFCLSGGLDSSSIVCAADKIIKSEDAKKPRRNSVGGVRMHTISSCFSEEKYKEYDEQEYIDEVVNTTGVESHKIYPDVDDLFSVVDNIIWHMDTPFNSTSVFAQWNVFQEAKNEGLKVMLDGQGADEQLAGYIGFESLLLSNLLKGFKIRKYREEIKQYREKRDPNGKNIRGLVLVSIRDAIMHRSIKMFATKFMLKRKKIDIPFYDEDYIRYKDKFFSSNNPSKYIKDQIETELPGLLQFEDRNSMAFSIESRVPFLDYLLAEETYSYPLYYKIQNGVTKKVLRDALGGVIPDKIKNRYSKLGFVTPEDKWMQENKNTFVEEFNRAVTILEPLINVKKADSWIRGKTAFERGNFTVWRVICAARWVKIFDVEI